MSAAAQPAPRILVVRLGAMGDILHTLPAVASLKQAYPGSRLTWLVEPRWAPLLEGNPFVDRLALLRRGSAASLFASWRDLRTEPYDFAVDFQGLIKSAVSAWSAKTRQIFGFDASQLRERAASIFYTRRTLATSAHVVDRNLELAAAAGAKDQPALFPLPPGSAQADLPATDFVLASPLAGWRSKQWPIEHYAVLARRLRQELGIPLVLDGPPGGIPHVPDTIPHESSLPGLIFATRRAAAVVGVDSGPMHLAAALGKPGVAIFGPTDPARNGPYGGSLTVLRSPHAVTTYKRGAEIDPSMIAISPDQVFAALRTALGCLTR
jgi:heptosyltransferase-1